MTGGPWRLAFFVVNVSAAALLLAVSIAAMSAVGEGAVFALLGGLLIAPFALVTGIAEWRLFSGGGRELERGLGGWMLLVGLIATFVLVTTIGEIYARGDRVPVRFGLVFGGSSVAIAGYAFTCATMRLRGRTTAPIARGFAVDERDA